MLLNYAGYSNFSWKIEHCDESKREPMNLGSEKENADHVTPIYISMICIEKKWNFSYINLEMYIYVWRHSDPQFDH